MKLNFLITVLFITKASVAQLANSYPNDVNIQNNPSVIFTEMFEDTAVSSMLTHWTAYSFVPSHISFNSSVPWGSSGNQSLKLRTIDGTNANEDTYLFKRFSPGINDSIFVRYYIKYNDSSTFHHSGVWVGGNYPPNPWPGNHAGHCPAGDSGFHVGTEVRGAPQSPQSAADFGFYNYWFKMHQSNMIDTSTGVGYFWGNEFISPNPISHIDMTQWNCIEVMVKLNNPVTDSTGELKLWINGILVSHYGQGFPNGTWNYSDFIEGTGSPFEGFQWRNNTQLNLNYIWVKNYSTFNPLGHINDLLFDHIVVAKNYIGPIYTATATNEINGTEPILISPNPANDFVKFSHSVKQVNIFSVIGQLLFSIQQDTNSVSTKELADGIYFIQADTDFYKLIVRH